MFPEARNREDAEPAVQVCDLCAAVQEDSGDPPIRMTVAEALQCRLGLVRDGLRALHLDGHQPAVGEFGDEVPIGPEFFGPKLGDL